MALLFRDFDKRVEIRSAREGLIRFRQHAEAVHYFRRHRSKTGLMATLRRMLSEHHHLQVRRLADEEVIDEIARRLLNGSLQLLEVCAPRVAVAVAIEGEVAAQTEEPIEVEAVAPTPSHAPAEPVTDEAAAEPEPELAAFESSVDVAAQVAVLVSAAESGVPFCEECARAAAVAAVTPAPPPAPVEPFAEEDAGPAPAIAVFDSSVDAAAQAAVLKDAAESGAPFCEECARAAAARAT